MNTLQKITVIIATLLIAAWLRVFLYVPINAPGGHPVIYYLLPVLLLAVYLIGAWFFYSHFKD